MAPTITIQATINAPRNKIWKLWTTPEHITQWNAASDDWHTPSAQNDVRVGGEFLLRMEAKDGSFGFDFTGMYDEVEENITLAYTLDDGRRVKILFEEVNGGTHITQTFDAENTNPLEMQREGWQSILNNFKKYVEEA